MKGIEEQLSHLLVSVVRSPLLISQFVLFYISIEQKEMLEDKEKRKFWLRKSCKSSSLLGALIQEESRSQLVYSRNRKTSAQYVC